MKLEQVPGGARMGDRGRRHFLMYTNNLSL